MKEVINVGIGGRSFTMNHDAYSKLKKYLARFKNQTKMGTDSAEVMDDLEERIAELFLEKITLYRNVVDITMVESVIAQLGMPNGEPFVDTDGGTFSSAQENIKDFINEINHKKLYRDPYRVAIGGVCSGLAIYLGIDVLLARVIFVLAFILGSAGFWIYIILWLVVPMANTATAKCKMYGLPVTAENLRRFTSK